MKTELRKLRRLLQRFAQFDASMQVSTVMVLLYVAEMEDKAGGLSTVDVQQAVGLSNAAASRNTNYWGPGTKSMTDAGTGYISVDFDPLDRRKRLLRLTPKGRAFVTQLMEVI